MKTIQIEVGKVKPNPFKKFINNGQLDDKRVKKLEESISHGTLPASFTGREVNEQYELGSGHHRVKAFENLKGKDFKIQFNIQDYTDEQMLIDMIRENITQRDSDFRDTEDSIVLARAWLNSGFNDVKQFDNTVKKQGFNVVKGKKGFQSESCPDSCRSIAKFLSKQGKAISYETIRIYLLVHDKLDPEIHEKVGKLELATDKEREGKIGLSNAVKLATVDKSDQKAIYRRISKEDLTHKEVGRAVTQFKAADDTTKRLVKAGKIPLSALAKVIGDDNKALVISQPKNVDEAIAELNDLSLTYSKKIALFSKTHLKNCTGGHRKFLMFHIAGTLEQLKKFHNKIKEAE